MRILLLALALLAGPAVAQDVLSIDPETPVRGRPVRITFSAPVDTVLVTYRPGAVTATTDTLFAGESTFEFTPSRAGVVSVEAGDATQSLSVRFRGTPVAGLVVMILAGVILFGGAAISLRSLLADGTQLDPTLRPDT